MCLKWKVQKFQKFLYGKSFILETDHQPLLYFGKAQYGQNGRLMRWALVLQQYQFTIKAIKGSENVGADFLSRHSVTPDTWMWPVTVYLFELFVFCWFKYVLCRCDFAKYMNVCITHHLYTVLYDSTCMFMQLSYWVVYSEWVIVLVWTFE